MERRRRSVRVHLSEGPGVVRVRFAALPRGCTQGIRSLGTNGNGMVRARGPSRQCVLETRSTAGCVPHRGCTRRSAQRHRGSAGAGDRGRLRPDSTPPIARARPCGTRLSAPRAAQGRHQVSADGLGGTTSGGDARCSRVSRGTRRPSPRLVADRPLPARTPGSDAAALVSAPAADAEACPPMRSWPALPASSAAPSPHLVRTCAHGRPEGRILRAWQPCCAPL